MIVNKTWHGMLLLFGVAGGIFLVLPHLADYIWQDEAYTLIRFSSTGPFYPFTNYHIPNNHPLFSSLISLWWDWGDSTTSIRLLPFIIFIFVMTHKRQSWRSYQSNLKKKKARKKCRGRIPAGSASKPQGRPRFGE